MNKFIITILFTLISVIGFAQNSFKSYESNNLNNELSTFPQTPKSSLQVGDATISNSQESIPSGSGAPGPGDQWVPIDDYQFYLVGLGVLLTGIVVYRRNQLQKA